MKAFFSSLAILLAATTIVGPAFGHGGGSGVGPGNPAAQNCVALGGVIEPYTTPAGQGANCAIDEWTLYKEMSDRGLVKDHQYPGPGAGMPNPAAVNCIDIGGEIRMESDPTGGQRGLCVVEEWALFRAIDVVTPKPCEP